jgi:hypothetical protein
VLAAIPGPDHSFLDHRPHTSFPPSLFFSAIWIESAELKCKIRGAYILRCLPFKKPAEGLVVAIISTIMRTCICGCKEVKTGIRLSVRSGCHPIPVL